MNHSVTMVLLHTIHWNKQFSILYSDAIFYEQRPAADRPAATACPRAAWPCSVCQPACLSLTLLSAQFYAVLATTTEKGTLTITKLLCMHSYTEALDAPTYDPHYYIYINNWCYWENYYNTHSTYIMIHSKGHSSLQFMFEALWTTICPSPALPCSTLPSQPARQPSSQPASKPA